jgi:Lon protease-like protein
LETIPLFPLNSILFPKGRISLQIFESRYVDMIRQCMKDQCGFGVVLIEKGNEVASLGQKLDIHRVGTYCGVVDWNQLPSGLLGVTVEGQITFKIVELLQGLSKHPAIEELKLDIRFENLREIAWRLSELLPISNREKQSLLELTDPFDRLEQIELYVSAMSQLENKSY